MGRTAGVMIFALLGAGLLAADDADTFFDKSTVKEVRLYFTDSNWYNTLYQAHASNADDPYFSATFQYGDTVIESIGARFKGNSSFRSVSSVKKSFKLKFNEYVPGTTFLGLKKLNLDNGALEPDLMREKLFLDFASQFVPATRSVHVRLYVNDVYWGLYTAVEQVDKTMMQDRFGGDEDGNLYEAGEANATLAYLGTDPAAYARVYSLRTNETTNDYSDLIKLTDVLNNTSSANLPTLLEPICDVENMLYGVALNILFVNMDSYVGSGSEFFLYDRQDTGQFVHLHVDLNEAFGTTGDGTAVIANPYTVSPFYLPSANTGGPGGGGIGAGGVAGSSSRPLMQKLWAVPAYKRLYLRQLARMLREGFDAVTMEARIQELADLIREDVYADTNKPYTNAQFESALGSGAVTRTGTTVYGLLGFVAQRYDYLRPLLDTYAEPADVRLNELMVSNEATLADESGEYEPWLELHNLGPGQVDLTGFYLTDDEANPTKWALPAQKLTDGGFLLLWLDGGTEEGDKHAGFRPAADGGSLHLYYSADGQQQLIDTVTYPALAAGRSYVRAGASGAVWKESIRPTPGEANSNAGTAAAAALRINEFLAMNQTILEDPDEPGAFEDWFEIYNSGTTAVDMSGMYISDNPGNPTKWRVPEGVKIEAGGYLLFWADADPKQGSLHTNFQLDSDGEVITLYDVDGTTLIDSVTFEAQQADVSMGRFPDGGEEWTTFSTPTPGAANAVSTSNWIVNAASVKSVAVAPASLVSAITPFLTTAVADSEASTLASALAGAEVQVTDSAGVSRAAPVLASSAGQVVFQIPAETTAGPATVTIRDRNGATIFGTMQIDAAAPGLFSAGATGRGVGAIEVVRVDSAGRETASPAYTFDSARARAVPAPIALGEAGDQVYLVLYGTGFGSALRTSPVSVRVGGEAVRVVSASVPDTSLGIDQVKVGPLPKRLAGRGDVDVVLKIAGKKTNTVSVTFQ
jgi:uncharacterized protein (TIGR03437 family)